jgi:hypothetical protein
MNAIAMTATLAQRYDKTAKGRDEIAQGRKNLRGKLRTVLFLVDGGKDVSAIQQQIALIGAPLDAISQLATDGYIAPVGPAVVAPSAAAVAVPANTGDALANFRIAKAFMNDTIVDARGIRAFGFTLKLERCATLQDLAAILPEFAEQLLKALDKNAVRAIVDRTRELVGR